MLALALSSTSQRQPLSPHFASRSAGASARLLALVGTHRVCPPEQTLARITPLLARMGITRLADVTQLDEIGIPVYQAVRPNGRTLSVAQGKGLTPTLAKVSAAMEAVETWHAENLILPTTRAPIGGMVGGLSYPLADLQLEHKHFLHPASEIGWVPATVLSDKRQTVVPRSYVELDLVATKVWMPPLFEATSNGLASGNTLDEATLHGLYEVIERDAEERVDLEAERDDRAVDLATVDDPGSSWLLARFRAAQVDVEVFDITGGTGIACFACHIWSSALPIQFEGYGCHLDRGVALSRALTEAAQSRLTVIAGSRDDVTGEIYSHCADFEAQALIGSYRRSASQPSRSYREIQSLASYDCERDLQEVVGRIEAYVGCSPMLVDLTQPQIGVPVVRVVAPRLRRGRG